VSSPTVPHRPPSSSVVLCRPPPSPAVFRCFPMLSAVFRRPPPSPAVLCSYLPSPGRSCLRSWGSSSLLMTAVLGIKGRGRTTFCRPVSSGGLGSPPAGPYGGPRRLRTLLSRITTGSSKVRVTVVRTLERRCDVGLGGADHSQQGPLPLPTLDWEERGGNAPQIRL